VIDRERIAGIEPIIRPHVRRTPVLEINGADLGIARFSITLKLELLQHAGSFKTRGAFANLLTREVPKAGVVAASGGNHGAAVAYAAMKLSVPAKVFVPSVASPAKIARIRGYGADLVVGGERYADALAASEAWQAETCHLHRRNRAFPLAVRPGSAGSCSSELLVKQGRFFDT
jgi:threonine dehydratase